MPPGICIAASLPDRSQATAKFAQSGVMADADASRRADLVNICRCHPALPGVCCVEDVLRKISLTIIAMGGLALGACAQNKQIAAAAPLPPGAVAGSVAADRDGDGIIDGYYTADGNYHANAVPQPPAPPPLPTRKGERG